MTRRLDKLPRADRRLRRDVPRIQQELDDSGTLSTIMISSIPANSSLSMSMNHTETMALILATMPVIQISADKILTEALVIGSINHGI